MSAMIQQHGTTTYWILWTIVFCETGLVLTPFLPGDSLLFAAGAFAGVWATDQGGVDEGGMRSLSNMAPHSTVMMFCVLCEGRGL